MPASELSPDDFGHVKGSVVRHFYNWFLSEYGMERVDAAFAAATETERAHFDRSRPGLGILPSVWYPERVVHRCIDMLTSGLTKAEITALTAKAGTAMVGQMLNGVQGVIVRLLLTPDRYRKHVQRSRETVYDTGLVTVVVHSPTCHESIITDWRGHHPVLCELNHNVRLEIYRRMRLAGVVEEYRRCTSHGDVACGSKIRWQ